MGRDDSDYFQAQLLKDLPEVPFLLSKTGKARMDSRFKPVSTLKTTPLGYRGSMSSRFFDVLSYSGSVT